MVQIGFVAFVIVMLAALGQWSEIPKMEWKGGAGFLLQTICCKGSASPQSQPRVRGFVRSTSSSSFASSIEALCDALIISHPKGSQFGSDQLHQKP